MLLRTFPAISKMLKSVHGLARSVVALLALMGVSLFEIGNGLLNKVAGLILAVINNRIVRYFHQGVGNAYQNSTLRVILKLTVLIFGFSLLRKHLWARYVKYWQHQIKNDELEHKRADEANRQTRLEALEKALVNGDWAAVDAIRQNLKGESVMPVEEKIPTNLEAVQSQLDGQEGKRESLLAYDHETKQFRVLGAGNVTNSGDEELKKLNAMAFLNDFE